MGFLLTFFRDGRVRFYSPRWKEHWAKLSDQEARDLRGLLAVPAFREAFVRLQAAGDEFACCDAEEVGIYLSEEGPAAALQFAADPRPEEVERLLTFANRVGRRHFGSRFSLLMPVDRRSQSPASSPLLAVAYRLGPVGFELLFYSDGRFLYRKGDPRGVSTRLRIPYQYRLETYLASPAFAAVVSELSQSGYKPGCCDMREVAVTFNGPSFGYPVCDEHPLSDAVREFVDLVNEIARNHLGGRYDRPLPTRYCGARAGATPASSFDPFESLPRAAMPQPSSGCESSIRTPPALSGWTNWIQQLPAPYGTTTFTQAFTWTPLGDPARLTYPTCSGMACPGGEPTLQVDHGYDAGFLTSLANPSGTDWVTDIQYHPNGLWSGIDRS